MPHLVAHEPMYINHFFLLLQGCRPLCGEFKTIFGWEVTQLCGGLGQRILNTAVTNIYCTIVCDRRNMVFNDKHAH